MPRFPTIAHVTLTVRDFGRSIPWSEALFSAEPFVDEATEPFRRVVWLVNGETVVGLHEFPDPADRLRFNERMLGLDHLAFRCRDQAELEQWRDRLDEVAIGHSEIVEADYGLGGLTGFTNRKNAHAKVAPPMTDLSQAIESSRPCTRSGVRRAGWPMSQPCSCRSRLRACSSRSG